MGLEEEVNELESQEKELISALDEFDYESNVKDIQDLTGLSQSAVMRSALNLEEDSFLQIIEETQEELYITEEGRSYLEESLPERKVLEVLAEEDYLSIDSLAEEVDLPEDKAGISIGWIKRKGWGEIGEEGGERVLRITDEGQKALEEEGKDELLLEEFEASEKLSSEQIPSDLEEEISTLKSRELVRVKEKTKPQVGSH